MTFLPICLLTTFISLNGVVSEVPADSSEALEYSLTETDIGATTYSLPDQTVSDGNALTNSIIVKQDNSELTTLMEEQIALLAENSSTVTGTLNSTILDLMDRMVDDMPSYYKYAGFRTDADDAYKATLYLSKKATLNNNTITFGDDCIAVNFYRVQYSNYNYYTTYERVASPNATVYINDDTIVYTNVAEGFPSLGHYEPFQQEYFWIGVGLIFVAVLFIRRINNA